MQTQQFDGPSLAALLSRVQALYGQQVKIIAARKARKGGVGGFFSREWFEVVVEVPDAMAVAGLDPQVQSDAALSATTAESQATLESVLKLAEELNSEQASVVNITTHDDSNLITAQPAQMAPTPAQEPLATQGYVAPAAPPVDVTSGSNDFASVLSRVQVEEKVEQPNPSASPSEFSSFVRVGPIANGIEMPEVTDSPAVHRKPRPEVELTNALIRRGMPRAMMPELSNSESYAAQLERVFKQCPVLSEKDLTQSRVIAVVGIDEEANEAAQFLAERLEVPSTQLAVAARQKTGRIDMDEIATTDDAVVMKRSWRRRNSPTVLAFSVKKNRSNLTWCREILSSLEPDMTIVVADAREKPEDIEASVNALAGVEAIIVENAASTSSPAAVLRLGIPVVYVDHQIATPRVWSNLLLEGLDYV